LSAKDLLVDVVDAIKDRLERKFTDSETALATVQKEYDELDSSEITVSFPPYLTYLSGQNELFYEIINRLAPVSPSSVCNTGSKEVAQAIKKYIKIITAAQKISTFPQDEEYYRVFPNEQLYSGFWVPILQASPVDVSKVQERAYRNAYQKTTLKKASEKKSPVVLSTHEWSGGIKNTTPLAWSEIPRVVSILEKITKDKLEQEFFFVKELEECQTNRDLGIHLQETLDFLVSLNIPAFQTVLTDFDYPNSKTVSKNCVEAVSSNFNFSPQIESSKLVSEFNKDGGTPEDEGTLENPSKKKLHTMSFNFHDANKKMNILAQEFAVLQGESPQNTSKIQQKRIQIINTIRSRIFGNPKQKKHEGQILNEVRVQNPTIDSAFNVKFTDMMASHERVYAQMVAKTVAKTNNSWIDDWANGTLVIQNSEKKDLNELTYAGMKFLPDEEYNERERNKTAAQTKQRAKDLKLKKCKTECDTHNGDVQKMCEALMTDFKIPTTPVAAAAAAVAPSSTPEEKKETVSLSTSDFDKAMLVLLGPDELYRYFHPEMNTGLHGHPIRTQIGGVRYL
jgi:hypothetical protein